MKTQLPLTLRRFGRLSLLALCASLPLSTPGYSESVMDRMGTEGTVSWRNANPTGPVVAVQIIGLNDLHGHLTSSVELEDVFDSKKAGGAAALAGIIQAQRLSNPARTLVLLAGDSFGGSPPLSGLLHDEPTLTFLNTLTDRDCPRTQRPAAGEKVPGNPLLITRCRVAAVVGNHEFDRGSAELERQIYGGAATDGPGLGRPWEGSHLTWLASNVVKANDLPFLPGTAVIEMVGVRVGVIGVVTSETPVLQTRGKVDDLRFLPEVETINASLARLKTEQVDATVLLIHEGLTAPLGPQTLPVTADEVSGRLAQILSDIDPGIDLVVSGHSHSFTNLLFRGKGPRPMLVTQARVDGTSYATIQLLIDRTKHQVVEKSAVVETVWTAGYPGMRPDEKVQKLIAATAKTTAPMIDRVVGSAETAITRASSTAGESALGNLVADAQRAAAHTDIAFMNAGGLRADLAAGPITWGSLYAVQPFGNHVMKCTLSGSQIMRLLESQWSGTHAQRPTILKISGMSYLYNGKRPAEHRVVAAYDSRGAELQPEHRYSVAASDYLLGGGDAYPVFSEVTDAVDVMPDIDALTHYVTEATHPLNVKIENRMTMLSNP